MGNKLGHAEAAAANAAPSASSAVSLDKSVAGKPPTSAASSSGRTKPGSSSLDGGGDDNADDLAAGMPPPMEPIAPLPASTNSTDGVPQVDLDSGGGGSLSPASLKPNESCDDATAAPSSSSGEPAAEETATVFTADSVEKAIQERSYRLQELLDSERVYVCDLEHCCQYIQYMRESKEKEDHEVPMPEDLRDGKDRMIFGNMEAIYEWHRE
jgi:hypothetical protein